MKSSRLRGAAFTWAAILASSSAFAQAPYFPSPMSQGSPQAFAQAPYSAAPMQYGFPHQNPQQFYSAPAPSFYSLPSIAPANPAPAPMYGQRAASPINLAGQANYRGYANGGTPMSFVSDQPSSVLAMPMNAPPSQGLLTQQNNSENIGPGVMGGQVQGAPGQYPSTGSMFPNQNYYYGYGQPSNGTYNGGSSYFGGNANGLNANGNGYGVYDGGNGYGCGDSCGVESCCAPCQPCWSIGVYGLWMTRDNYDNSTFSFDTANEAVQYSNARDVNADWDGGLGITAAYSFNCGCNALEFVYWGWYPDDAAAYTYTTQLNGGLNGIFNWDSLTYNGLNADAWVDNAQVHGLWRQTEVNNFELNVLRFGGGGCSRVSYSMFFGSRIFVYEDALTFGADTTDTVFDGDASELYYSIQTRNKLYGFQIGGVGSFCVTPRFSLNGGTKYGVFVNKISHHSQIGGPAGTAVINNGPYVGQPWNVQSSEDDVSFLGELFLGASYCITPRWQLSAGYRAIAVTGIAQPTDQIYPDLRGINDVASIEATSSMILHGTYLGAQFCW